MTVRVLHAATKMFPLLKTGGLADVVGALPPAQSQLGTHARVVLPGFPAVLDGLTDLETVADLGAAFGAGNVRLKRGVLAPHGADPQWQAHDWHAGLAPAYLRAAERQGAPHVASVMTVHNLAYQGTFPAAEFGALQLPGDFFAVDGVEFYGHVSFLKAGLYYADRITTVSPTYAREIQTQTHGAGLHGLLQTRTHDIASILNGVDYSIWNPSIDDSIASRYTAAKPSNKSKCKSALQERMGLKQDGDALLFGVVSRLTEQKGLDLLLSALPDIVRGGQLAVLGTGDPALETGLKNAAAHPGAVAVELGFNETLSHSIIAGSDVVMVPSRFEPCGLTQLTPSPTARRRSCIARRRAGGYRRRLFARKSRRRTRDRLRLRYLQPGEHRRRDPARLRAQGAPPGMESRRQARDDAKLRLGDGRACAMRKSIRGCSAPDPGAQLV